MTVVGTAQATNYRDIAAPEPTTPAPGQVGGVLPPTGSVIMRVVTRARR
jgi:hypothetical protein